MRELPAQTFGEQVLSFQASLAPPALQVTDVAWLLPGESEEARRCTELFYRRFYGDHKPRLFMFGINPGRFGGGVTGVPFTDGPALTESCGIPNELPVRREISAEFVHRVVAACGGAASFFGQFYITSVCPLGLTRAGANFNYYDDRTLAVALEPFIVDAIKRQLAFGARRNAAVVIGTGKNFDFMRRLNAEHGFFRALLPLEHPRFIMQYRRKRVDEYVETYQRTLLSLLEP